MDSGLQAVIAQKVLDMEQKAEVLVNNSLKYF